MTRFLSWFFSNLWEIRDYIEIQRGYYDSRAFGLKLADIWSVSRQLVNTDIGDVAFWRTRGDWVDRNHRSKAYFDWGDECPHDDGFYLAWCELVSKRIRPWPMLRFYGWIL